MFHASIDFEERAAVQLRYIEFAKTVVCTYNSAIEAVECLICIVCYVMPWPLIKLPSYGFNHMQNDGEYRNRQGIGDFLHFLHGSPTHLTSAGARTGFGRFV